MFGFNSMVPYDRSGRQDFIDNFFSEPFFGMLAGTEMKTDIRETAEGYELTAEIPGASKEDIRLNYDRNDILSIGVSRKEEKKTEKNGYIRKERREGSSRREFYLPGIDGSGIQAKYENGVLSVKLPKNKEQSSDTHIDIG